MKTALVLILSLISAHSFALESNKGLYVEISVESKTDLYIPDPLTDTAYRNEITFEKTNSSSRDLLPYVVPLVPVVYGMMSLGNNAVSRFDHQINHEMMEGRPLFSPSIEDKFQYVPVAAVYALNALGIEGKNTFIDRTVIYLMANSCKNLVVSMGKTHLLKERPTGDLRSFPSAHTATAFTAAEFMHQEYKDSSPLLSYTGYSFAALTGFLRMQHNKHWLSDVVAGAGAGILSTKLSYLAYPWIKNKLFHKKSPFIILPSYADKTYGLSLNASLGAH